MPSRSEHHLILHSAAPEPGLPAGPPTPVNEAQTTDLAGNNLASAPGGSGPCASVEARAAQAQCRVADAAGFPTAPLVCIALACAGLAAGLWMFAGREARRWVEGQGWSWHTATRAAAVHSSTAHALRRRRHIGLAIVGLALALAAVSIVAGQPG